MKQKRLTVGLAAVCILCLLAGVALAVNCEVCGGAGYVALKSAQSGEYVAVACPECASSGAAVQEEEVEVYPTLGYDETVKSFMDFYELRCSENEQPFVFTTRDSKLEQLYLLSGDNMKCTFFMSADGAYKCNFLSEKDEDAIQSIELFSSDPSKESLDLVTFAALVFAEGTGALDEEYADWCFATAEKLLAATKEVSYTYDLGVNTVTLQRELQYAPSGSETPYVFAYRFMIK